MVAGQQGAFTFVLHSHIPYTRLAGRWPHGEEWIHEAAVETYIPLLNTLYDLRDANVPFRLTLGITPVLAEQLADADILAHLEQYLDAKIAACAADRAYYAAPGTADPTLSALAARFQREFAAVKTAFQNRFKRDLIGAFRQLQDDGYLDILTSAATHAYLPLLSRDSSLRAQLLTGIRTHERLFGRKPTGIWLPECAYRPAYVSDDGVQRQGLEALLAEFGLRYFFSETHAITGGQPVGVAAGEVIGPYGSIQRRYVIPPSRAGGIPARAASIFRAYDAANAANGGNPSGVAVIGRNNVVAMQVWSAELGYPGDFDYREFHKRAGTSGMRYWRVTGVKLDLAQKDMYHPEWAAIKIDQHAEHFAHVIGDQLRDFRAQANGEFGLVAANFDTELFGHWWHEGVEWLGNVLRHLAVSREIQLMTAAEYLDAHPPAETLMIPESSWGSGGGHFTWDNGDTHWMWLAIHEAEARMERLAAREAAPESDEEQALAQVARELLLAQSSDWSFLVTTGQAREYAIQRFSIHMERFDRLADSIEAGQPDQSLSDSYRALDNLFADIDYRVFRGV
jgi:1,4-alpha-glucan branching enzyme